MYMQPIRFLSGFLNLGTDVEKEERYELMLVGWWLWNHPGTRAGKPVVPVDLSTYQCSAIGASLPDSYGRLIFDKT